MRELVTTALELVCAAAFSVAIGFLAGLWVGVAVGAVLGFVLVNVYAYINDEQSPPGDLQ